MRTFGVVNRNMLRLLLARPRVATVRPIHHVALGIRYMAFRSDEPEGPSEADMRAAREWLASFDLDTIPKKLCDISFSRSSGPGGQNVNKYDDTSSCIHYCYHYYKADFRIQGQLKGYTSLATQGAIASSPKSVTS